MCIYINKYIYNLRKQKRPLAQRGALFRVNPGVVEALHSSRYSTNNILFLIFYFLNYRYFFDPLKKIYVKNQITDTFTLKYRNIKQTNYDVFPFVNQPIDGIK